MWGDGARSPHSLALTWAAPPPSSAPRWVGAASLVPQPPLPHFLAPSPSPAPHSNYLSGTSESVKTALPALRLWLRVCLSMRFSQPIRGKGELAGASEWLAWRRESRSQSEPNEPRGCGSKECVLSFEAESVSTPRRPQEPDRSNPSRGGRLSASQGKQKDSCLVGSYGARSTGTSRRLTVALSRLSAVSNRRLRATAYPSLNSHWFLCHKCPSRFPSQLTPVLPSEADAMPSSPLSLLQPGRI